MLTEQIRAFKRKLAAGPVYGVFSKTSDPALIEILGRAGLDFVIIDLEHGPNTIESAQNLVRAAELGGVFPVIRTREGDPTMIGAALDIGAGGVEVPQVGSREQAVEVLRHARFAPAGMRGVCRFVRAAEYSALERSRYFAESNEALIVCQLEGAAAVESLDGILEAGGVDVLFIGPYDLSQSLGVPGQVEHPSVVQTMTEVVERCLRRSVAVGTFVDGPEAARRWRAIGVRYLACSVDVGIFYGACRDLSAALRGGT
jgi:4-hydroxy-2-oxoheptanedioate aldolase